MAWVVGTAPWHWTATSEAGPKGAFLHNSSTIIWPHGLVFRTRQFCRDFLRQGGVTADHLRGRTCQLQIPVGRQSLIGHEMLAHRRLVRHLVDRCPLIDFVEHADEDRANAQRPENGELAPVELTLTPRDLCRSRLRPPQVIPGKAWECRGHVALARVLQLGQVAFPDCFANTVHGGVVAITAGIPGAEGVEGAVDLRPRLLGAGGATSRPPVRVHSADEIDVAVLLVILEERDQLFGLLRRPGAVLEPEPPQEHYRLALVVEIACILADFDLVAQELPVVDNRCRGG